VSSNKKPTLAELVKQLEGVTENIRTNARIIALSKSKAISTRTVTSACDDLIRTALWLSALETQICDQVNEWRDNYRNDFIEATGGFPDDEGK
jgi:hypothetical protein